MKKVFVSILCLGSAAAFAQESGMTFTTKTAEPAAVITARLDKAPNDTVVALYEPYSGDTASAIIKNHQFTMRMPMKKGGSIYILQIGNNPEKGGTVLYLEDGATNIRGKGSNFNDARFTGAPYVKEWQEVAKITDPFSGDGKLLTDLQNKYYAAKAIGDEDAYDSILTKANAVDARMKDKLKKWVTANPNSGVCGYILTVYFSRDKQFVDSVYNTLGAHAKAQRILMRYKNPGKVDAPPATMSAGNGTPGESAGKVKIGAVAPDFEVADLAGNLVKLSAFKGKYVFIDFWASWCTPCVAQFPHMKELYAKFKDKNFVFMGVSLDTKREGWEKAINKHQLNWLNVSNLKGWGEPIAGLYGVRAIPSNVLIGPDGNVIANDLGGEALIKKLEELLK